MPAGSLTIGVDQNSGSQRSRVGRIGDTKWENKMPVGKGGGGAEVRRWYGEAKKWGNKFGRHKGGKMGGVRRGSVKGLIHVAILPLLFYSGAGSTNPVK